MRQGCDANRAAGDTQMVQVGVRKLVLGKKRPVPSQVEVRSRKGQDAGAVPLVLSVAHPANDRFHVRDYRAYANADIWAGSGQESPFRVLRATRDRSRRQ